MRFDELGRVGYLTFIFPRPFRRGTGSVPPAAFHELPRRPSAAVGNDDNLHVVCHELYRGDGAFTKAFFSADGENRRDSPPRIALSILRDRACSRV